MRKLIFAFFILVSTNTSFAQQKNFGTKTIGQWSFEKFPLHYLVTPTKSMSYKNARTGKLEGYQELNQTGQTNGLFLTMCTDGIYPHDATYTYKGEVVYIVQFLPNSKTAQSITTFNVDGLKDGYQINRTLKSSGGYTEEIEKYIDGDLVELNGVKQALFSVVYKDSLLDGRFKFENGRSWIIEGVAEMGELKKIKQTQDGKYFMCEIEFLTDSIKVKKPKYSGDGFTYETYPINTIPSITNSKSYCMKFGNYSGYPFLLIPKEWDIRDLITLVTQFFPDTLTTIVNFKDSLLDGNFQYRQYIYTGGYKYSSFINVSGKAVMGKLQNISTRVVELDSHSGVINSDKKINYTFNENTILQKDYVAELPDEPVFSTTFKLEYPVLLTNSKILGGTFSIGSTSWDLSTDNPDNIFGTPYKREARLKDNKYGYVFFSPFTFDISNYLGIVKTKTEKPYENNVEVVNGFLEGDFDFKEDGIQFIGFAKTGIIQKLRITQDFKSSKTIIAPGTDLNGKDVYYDKIELTLNGDKMDISYILSLGNKTTYQESIQILKNKKITTTESLASYDNFVYVENLKGLRRIMIGLNFFDSQQ